MQTKRIRIFAGPNGSGKSTIYQNLAEKGDINLGIFVNADDIERLLKVGARLDFTNYGLSFDIDQFCRVYQQSSFYVLSGGDKIIESISAIDNNLVIKNTQLINSYFAAFITDYIRVNMLDCVDVFSVETVLSHPSKIDFINLAKSKGYRVYLYFVSTRNVEINISRVHYREQTGGHSVPVDKIASRYSKSLDNLYAALMCSNRAYLFDNSSNDKPIWYAEFDEVGLHIKESAIPFWIKRYLIDKLNAES